jgi:hypothetical protein
MPANLGVAPICNAKAEPPDFSVKPPTLPRFTVPDVSNPKSIIRSIQQLQTAINLITNQVTVNNVPDLFRPTGGQGGQLGSSQTSPDQQNQPGDWVETNRVTQNVKVVNPDDDSQFVIVKEVTSITLTNSTTGDTITWRL